MNDSINIGHLVERGHKYDVSISNESPEDATARRLMETADADQKNESL